MPNNALITGATGFIGSHLAKTLVSEKWHITCLHRPFSRIDFLKKLGVKLVAAKENTAEALEPAVAGQDYVFHLAGRIRSASRRVYDVANHQLTRNLLQACLARNPSLKRFVYVSSIAAAGPSPPGVFLNESSHPSPTSEYGRSKLRGEEAVKEAWERLPATIIRPPNVYGPRQQEVELLIKAIRCRLVPLLKRKAPMTSLIYIDDLVQGILQAAFSPKTVSQTYYLTDGKAYSWREVILTLKKHLLGTGLFFPLPEELIEFLAFLADMVNETGLVRLFFGRKIWRAMTRTPWLFSSLKAEKDFGFRARCSLEEGIRKTVDYYRR